MCIKQVMIILCIDRSYSIENKNSQLSQIYRLKSKRQNYVLKICNQLNNSFRMIEYKIKISIAKKVFYKLNYCCKYLLIADAKYHFKNLLFNIDVIHNI